MFFTEALCSNGVVLAIRCSGNVITETLLTNGRRLWLHYSDFQEVFTELLPSNGHIRHNIGVAFR
jgi:hypothetical protein